MGHIKPVHGQSAKKDHLDRLLSQSFFTFATTAMIFIVRIIKNAIISRLLGPTLKGGFVMIILIPEIIVAFGNLGFGTGMMFYAIKKKCNFREIAGSSTLFFFILMPLLTIACYFVLQSDLIDAKIVPLVAPFSLLIIIAVPFLLLRKITRSLLMARSFIGRYNVIRFLEGIGPLLIFLGIFFWIKNPLTAAVWGWLISLFTVAIITVCCFAGTDTFPIKFSKALTLKGLKFGLLSHPANFLQFTLLRVDFFFISMLLGPKELGFYAISTALTEILLSVSESVFIPFAPLLLGMNNEDSKNFSPQIICLILVLMTFLCFTMALIGGPIISLLFGKAFAPAYPALLFLLPGVIALGIHPILKINFFRENQPGTVSVVSALVLIQNIILNVLLIPKGGICAAALSSSISYTTATLLLAIILCRRTQTSLSKLFIPSREDIHLVIEKIQTIISRSKSQNM